MNIEGLDYNTQRSQLVLPEYGREIQEMVEYCTALPSRQERLRCAKTIVAVMGRMHPQNRTKNRVEWERRLWDHLAILSDFKLDIDWPYDISEARSMQTKPEPMKYPTENIRVRHYGRYIFKLFDKLKTMEPGVERDNLVRLTANQMKRDLMLWSHGYTDDEKVADDLARYTDGKIQLDLAHFKFAKVDLRETEKKRKKK